MKPGSSLSLSSRTEPFATPHILAAKVAVMAGAFTALFLLSSAAPCHAGDTSAPGQSDASSSCPVLSYFGDWFERVSKIQSEQPHWVTPLVTVTPRLEEELRYDQMWENLPGGHLLTSYGGGGGKGLELIPARNVEVIIGIPSWQTESTSPVKNGWSDQSFLLKYRLLSANEKEGNYIVTAFMGLAVPSGSANMTAHHYSYSPTIAFGKGWGDFDFQSTLGTSIPDNGAAATGAGTPVLFNTTLQYHVMKYFWPEVEANYTYWPNGEHEGLNQLFLTPGLLVGRIPIAGRLGLTIGVGCQVAVTDTPRYHQNYILTARLPF
jgi:hypothetical protein